MQQKMSLKDVVTVRAITTGMAVMSFGGFAMAADEGKDIPGLITAALATVGLIGAAVLSVYASIKIFKLVRAAL
jgi:hypothetical protein